MFLPPRWRHILRAPCLFFGGDYNHSFKFIDANVRAIRMKCHLEIIYCKCLALSINEIRLLNRHFHAGAVGCFKLARYRCFISRRDFLVSRHPFIPINGCTFATL
jgi:hypothetical protein